MTRENQNLLQPTSMITLLTLKLYLPGCSSLKEKRGRIQPILTKLKKEFHLSVSEVGLQDVWQSAWISCVVVSNDAAHNNIIMNEAVKTIEMNFPDELVIEQHLESR